MVHSFFFHPQHLGRLLHQQCRRYDCHKPKYALLHQGSLLRGIGTVKPHILQYKSGHHAAQRHSGFIENACQGVNYSRYASAVRIFAIAYHLRHKGPHVSGSHDDARRLYELRHIDEPHIVTRRFAHRYDIKHGHAGYGYCQENVEHLFLADPALDGRNHRHKDECRYRPEAHEDGEFGSASVHIVVDVVCAGRIANGHHGECRDEE